MDLRLDADLLLAGFVQERLARVRLDQAADVGREGLEVFGYHIDCTVEVVVELGVFEQFAPVVGRRVLRRRRRRRGFRWRRRFRLSHRRRQRAGPLVLLVPLDERRLFRLVVRSSHANLLGQRRSRTKVKASPSPITGHRTRFPTQLLQLLQPAQRRTVTIRLVQLHIPQHKRKLQRHLAAHAAQHQLHLHVVRHVDGKHVLFCLGRPGQGGGGRWGRDESPRCAGSQLRVVGRRAGIVVVAAEERTLDRYPVLGGACNEGR